MKNLSEKIKNAREERDLTLEQLAKEVGSSRGYIWQIEKGDKKKPSFDIVIRISKALGVSLNYLADQETIDMSSDEKNKILLKELSNLDSASKKIIEDLIKHLSSLIKSSD